MSQSNLDKSKAEVALRQEFGARVCTLTGGSAGLRGGLACAIKELGTEAGEPVIQFIGSTNQVDRYNEVIEQSGWELGPFKANPVVPDCHNYDSVARILGRADRVAVENDRLVNDVRFCLDNPLGAMAYKMTKGGFIKSQSVGFIPLEWQNGKAATDPERTYKKCELLEISLVVVPANAGATIGLALKSGALQKRDVQAVMDQLKEFCGDDTQNPNPSGGASGIGNYDAQLLQMARSLKGVLLK